MVRPAARPTPAGPWAPNKLITDAVRFAEDVLARSEDLTIDGQGRLYTGTADGGL